MRAAEQRRIRKLDRWRRRQGLPPKPKWWETDRSEALGKWDKKTKAAMFDPTGLVTNSREQELEDFARLGPRVKQALHGCLFMWSATDILEEFERRKWRVRRDDGRMADIIKAVDKANHKRAACFAMSQDDQ